MIESINLNLIPNGVNPVCHVSQYDAGRQIKINLFEGINPYTIQSGDSFTLNVRKPDNTIVTTSVSGTQGYTYITISTTEQIAAVVGENLCELKITNGSTVIGTLNFIMQVERDVLADGIPSQSVIEDLDERIAEAIGDNYYNKTETDALLNEKANANSVYTKTETDNLLDKKADIDGVYEDLTAGNAEALLTDKYQENKIPYNFRKSGGALTVGSREIDELVGGTLAFNQLVQNGNFIDINYWLTVNCSKSANNNILTVTRTNSGQLQCYQYITTNPNHKYLAIAYMRSSSLLSANLRFGNNYINKEISNNVWTEFSKVLTVTSTNTEFNFFLISGVMEINSSFDVKTAMLIDLTQMFGATIADYIYSLEQGTAGAGVAYFRSLFPNDYYAYNAGELMSVKTSAHKTVGFNQWDEDWENGLYYVNGLEGANANCIRTVNYIKVIPNTIYCLVTGTSSYFRIVHYDINKAVINTYTYVNTGNVLYTIPNNCYYIKFCTLADSSTFYGGTYNNDICVSFSGSKNGTYEPYKERTYPLDANLELRGIAKLDANNKLYYDGDTYESDGNVTRKYGVVDLGSLSWSRNTDLTPRFSAILSDAKRVSDNYKKPNFITKKYLTMDFGSQYGQSLDMGISMYVGTNTLVIITDNNYTDAATFKTAMSGVYLVYELATATTEEAASYFNPQVVDTYGTEEYIDNRAVAMPVGHNTKYLWDLKQKVEQLYGIPEAPTTNGNYKLVCTVSSGTPTYSWVLDT